MNPFALFLLVAATGLLLGAALSADGWRLLAFVGTTLLILGLLIEAATHRKAHR